MFAGVNWVAVLVAGLASVVIGWLWYAPFVAGNRWMELTGKTREQVEADFHPLMIAGALAAGLVTAAFLAEFIRWTGAGGALGGASVGLWAGVGFVGTAFAVNDIFETRPRGLTVLNGAHHVLGLVVMGLILGAWR